MSLVFIVKNSIRRKAQFYRLVEEFRSFRILDRVEIRETRHEQHAVTLALQAVREGFSYIIAVGGDGTLNQVINGVMEHPGSECKVGFFPYGSGNDFSLSVSPFYSAAQLSEAIRKEKVISCDLGLLHSVDLESKTHKNWFINVMDAGIGAAVVKKVNRSKKWLGSAVAYAHAIFNTFLTYTASDARLLIDGKEVRRTVMTIVVANGKSFGNGLIIAPDARTNDGKFNVVIIGKVGVFQYLRYLKDIRKGKTIDHPQVWYFTGKQISIEPSGHSLPVEYDGEFGGYAPLRAEIHPGALKMITPL